jgi:predicted acetyltransferase
MVEFAKINQIEQVRNLWKTSFGETDEYLNFYFNTRYTNKYTLVYNLNNIAVSSAQFYPFDMTFYDEYIKTEYVLGVCTHLNNRNMGYAKSILLHGIENAKNNGVDVLTLIPQEDYLFKIYEKFGFTEMFDVTDVLFKNKYAKSINVHEYTDSYFEELFDFYTIWYTSKSGRVIKNRDDFAFTLEDIFINGGKIYLYINNNTIAGFATISLQNNTIKEILFYDDIVKVNLINGIFEKTGVKTLNVVFAGKYKDIKSKALGMSRVINPLNLLQIYAKNNSHAKFSFKLVDVLIKSNCHVYSVDNSKITVDTVDNYDFSIDIKHFTHFILGYKPVENFDKLLIKSDSYLNLMLN